MFRRRVATAALLCALVGAACASHDKPVQVLGESFTRSDASSPSSISPTTAITATTATTLDPTTTPAAPAPPASSEPETTVPTTGTVTVNPGGAAVLVRQLELIAGLPESHDANGKA